MPKHWFTIIFYWIAPTVAAIKTTVVSLLQIIIYNAYDSYHTYDIYDVFDFYNTESLFMIAL